LGDDFPPLSAQPTVLTRNAHRRCGQRQCHFMVTKDRDFAELVARLGPPPGIILLSCGNTSTVYLRTMLRSHLAEALRLIRVGEPLVEIGGAF
jgi:predicted nuclease of predicted toxin-antitoxin system